MYSSYFCASGSISGSKSAPCLRRASRSFFTSTLRTGTSSQMLSALAVPAASPVAMLSAVAMIAASAPDSQETDFPAVRMFSTSLAGTSAP